MDATDIWDEGRREPSLKAEILSYLRRHDDEMFIPPDIRTELFPDISPPFPDSVDDISEGDRGKYRMVILHTAEIRAILEILVDEGAVEKRTFLTDISKQIGRTKDEEDIIRAAFGEEREQTYYRAVRE